MKTKNLELSRCGPTRNRKLSFLGGVTAIAVFLLAGSYSARAFTTADADTAINAFNNAYYVGNNGNGYFKNDQNGGVSYFWTQAELIESVEDANNRTGGTYSSMITSLLNGFSANNGTSWSGDIYNDDVCWACIAYLRGYQATGNTTFRTIAKSNFDMMYARAWDTTFGGGLWWTTAKGGKNACVNGPGAIVAYLLYTTLNDSSYLTKAQNIYNWEKATLFNASSGAIYDNITTSGLGTWSSTYNQGTFIGAADYVGDTASATLAMNFTRNVLSFPNGNGYTILPEYGIANNNSGFNGIGIRWMAKFMTDRGLQSTYLGWLQANANAAWGNRRTSDNLSWCQWSLPTPSGYNFYSWDSSSSAVALQVVPADGANTPIGASFMIVNKYSGKCLDLIGGNLANSAPVCQWTYDSNGPNQRWAILPTINTNHFKLISWVSGKCFCIQNASTASNAPALQFDYVGNPDQQFDLVDAGNGWFKLKNVNSGLVMDNGSQTADNAPVTQQPDAGYVDRQLWRIQPWGNYYIRANSGRYVVCYGRGTADGTPIAQYDWEGNPWYQWQFTSVSDGYYSCFSLYSGRLICLLNESSTPGDGLVLWDYDPYNTGGQRIRLMPKTNGTFKFYFKLDGECWDLPGNNPANNVLLQQWTDVGTPQQTFRMERVP